MTLKPFSFPGLATALALPLFLACGGGGGGGGGGITPAPPTLATTLAYTNPTNGDYKLVKSTAVASTASHLVLDLVGPSGITLGGVGFLLTTNPSQVTWSKVVSTDSVLAENPAFISNATDLLLKTKTANGVLQVGIYQKGILVSPITTSAETVLARVALDLASATLTSGTSISLSPNANKALIMNPVPTSITSSSNPTTAITITVGTLVAN